MSLLWVRINCDHAGFDDLADELLDCTINEGRWWLYWDMFKSMLKPTILEAQCLLVMAIILMV